MGSPDHLKLQEATDLTQATPLYRLRHLARRRSRARAVDALDTGGYVHISSTGSFETRIRFRLGCAPQRLGLDELTRQFHVIDPQIFPETLPNVLRGHRVA